MRIAPTPDHPMIEHLDIEQEDYPERTGLAAQTERYFRQFRALCAL